MSVPEVAHLEMLAQVDELVSRLAKWAEAASPWEPLDHCRALVRRLLERVETLRLRLESPLVVATFGGTGTGKSALVNALVGRECTPSGRQRPTTTRPVLIAHPQTDLALCGLPLDDFDVVRCDAPIVRDVILIDCPDPDTTEAETQSSNLARLHHVLPYCDVLLYTSTQQKYRSARVGEELLQSAAGCRLVFVQTCAEIDADIRDDWQTQLDSRYRVPEIFFLDSLRALREQQAGQRPGGEFGRLLDLLSRELASSHRVQIRRANLVDLVHEALAHCRGHVERGLRAVEKLSAVLVEQHERLTGLMSDRLRDELLASRALWERRLLTAVTQNWGLSPFSIVLRVYNGLGNVLASAGLLRARSTAQMALIGAVQGARWLAARQQEHSAEGRLARFGACGLDDTVLRESQLVVAGYVHEARFDARLVEGNNLEALRQEAARVEDQFLSDAGRRVDEIIGQLAKRHSGWLARGTYESLLTALLAYIVGWPAWNFFYAYPRLGQPLVPADFYVHGAVFLLIWSGALVMAFTARLRKGLSAQVAALARDMAHSRLALGLYPRLDEALSETRLAVQTLEALSRTTAELRREIATGSGLGAPLEPVALHRPAASA